MAKSPTLRSPLARDGEFRSEVPNEVSILVILRFALEYAARAANIRPPKLGPKHLPVGLQVPMSETPGRRSSSFVGSACMIVLQGFLYIGRLPKSDSHTPIFLPRGEHMAVANGFRIVLPFRATCWSLPCQQRI